MMMLLLWLLMMMMVMVVVVLRSRRMDKVGTVAIDHLGSVIVVVVVGTNVIIIISIIIGGSCCRCGKRCRNVGGSDMFLQMAQPVAQRSFPSVWRNCFSSSFGFFFWRRRGNRGASIQSPEKDHFGTLVFS